MGEGRRRSTVFGLLFALACAVALAIVPSAQAANIVPNPGFESNCSGVPCNWSVVPGTAVTLAYDTVNPNPPSTASMSVTVAQSTAIGAVSDCVPVALAPGPYSASFWYRTTATLTHVPGLAAFGYANNNCTGSSFSLGNLNAPSTISDGAWHVVSGTLAVPNAFAAHSMQFEPFFQCACNQTTTATVNFDDVAFETTPLAVTVYGLRATRSHRGVVLRWRTGTEADTLGFNVYRQTGARRVLVNRRLIPAVGAVAGSLYSYRDRSAPQHRALRYWLQDVAVDGTRTWHGSVRLSGT
jgi:hypothetical protein